MANNGRRDSLAGSHAREMPKHKASEKLQAELKQKLSRSKKELEAERKSPKAGHGVRIPRQAPDGNLDRRAE